MAPLSRKISPETPLGAPAWRPRRPRSHPRGAQDAPRAAQELPQSCPGSDPQAPWGEDTPQSSPRLPPDFDFGPFWRRFGRILGSFWMDFWKDFQTNRIHTLETIRWPCWGGCAPPGPPLLRGVHLEERTVAGTPLCGARVFFFNGNYA